MVETTMIFRFGPPNKQDHQSHKTLCKVIRGDGKFDLYMQASKEESNPNWIIICENCDDDKFTDEFYNQVLDQKL